VLHVIETESGEVLPDRIPFTSNATVAWLPDESGFAVNAGTAPDFERVDKVLLVHRLGQPEPSLPEPIEVREPYCVYPQVSGDGRWLAGDHERGRAPRRLDPRAPGRRLAPVPARRRRHVQRRLRRGQLRRRLHGGAPRGRLVRIPIATAADRQTWSELIPESDLVLRFVQRAGDLLVVGALAGGVLRRDRRWPDGRLEEVELPVAGLVSRSASHSVAQPAAANEGTGVAGDEDGFSFVARSARPLRRSVPVRARRGPVVRAQAAGRSLPVRRHALRGDGAGWRHGRLRGRPPRGSRARAASPAVLYRLRRLERRARARVARANAHLVEAGAAFVLCHIRGGGEEGTDFHRDGALERKQHSYDDLYAIAEDIAARGIADPARLAVLGGSNGGLMVAVAVTQRPDLWCAACSLVPVTDMLRATTSAPTAKTAACGNTATPAIPPTRRCYGSTRRTTTSGPEFPIHRTLVCRGRERHCAAPAWHARKFVARLQDEAEGGPFVLRVMGGGHLSTRRWRRSGRG
jgi:prolyl oligopeptidase